MWKLQMKTETKSHWYITRHTPRSQLFPQDSLCLDVWDGNGKTLATDRARNAWKIPMYQKTTCDLLFEAKSKETATRRQINTSVKQIFVLHLACNSIHLPWGASYGLNLATDLQVGAASTLNWTSIPHCWFPIDRAGSFILVESWGYQGPRSLPSFCTISESLHQHPHQVTIQLLLKQIQPQWRFNSSWESHLYTESWIILGYNKSTPSCNFLCNALVLPSDILKSDDSPQTPRFILSMLSLFQYRIIHKMKRW